MRKFSLFLLLATSAMPALAQRGEDGDRESRRASQAERSESRAERPQRAERAERMERREAREQRQVQVEGQVQPDAARIQRMERFQQRAEQQQGEGSRSERIQRYQQRVLQEQGQEGGRAERLERYRQRQVELGQQAEGGALAPRERRIRTIPTLTPQVGQAGPVRTDVRVDHRRYDRDRQHRWSNYWRNDRRYDWRRHRDRNRLTFSIGFYSDPFGYGYRRFGLGSYLYPSYYQSNYWISDPWQYRLPPAYGPYRWVRYHNDAVLIDVYSGEVVDVIYGFFW